MLDSIDEVPKVLARALHHGGLVLHEAELSPEFFDLRSGIAGELFQKVVNYHGRLAIVAEDYGKYGDRFNELVFEHQSHAQIRFFKTTVAAEDWLTGSS